MILAGPPPSPALLKQTASESDYIVVADGGLACCLSAGIRPDIALGDMDSIDLSRIPADWKIVADANQDTTDFEKALLVLPQEPLKNMVIVGGLGGRVDHELTNLHIASRLNPAWMVVFRSDNTNIYRCASNLTLDIPIGETISLIPWPMAQSVTTQGLHWDLQNAELSGTGKFSQSNRVESTPVRINLKHGMLFVIHPLNV